MELKGYKEGNAFVVKANGRLDTISAPEFEKSLSKWMEQGKSKFILDLEGLEYISSAGLRSILLSAKRLKAVKGTLAFCCLSPMVAEVFSLSNFGSLFALHDTLEKALS